MSIRDIIDLNNNGVIEEKEMLIFKRRIRTQRRIAVLSFVSILMMAFGLVILTGFEFISIEMVEGFSTFLGWFFTVCGGIVLAYMGIEASSLLTKK